MLSLKLPSAVPFPRDTRLRPSPVASLPPSTTQFKLHSARWHTYKKQRQVGSFHSMLGQHVGTISILSDEDVSKDAPFCFRLGQGNRHEQPSSGITCDTRAHLHRVWCLTQWDLKQNTSTCGDALMLIGAFRLGSKSLV